MDKGKVDPIGDCDINHKQVPFWCSYRFALAFVGFLGFVNLYALRVNMSVAMVCMINNTALAQGQNDQNITVSPINPACDNNLAFNGTVNMVKESGEFAWDKKLQGVILGSFFWGYLVTQIPGGWLAQRFGGKRVFGYCMLVTAIATLLTPVGSRASPYVLMTLRLIKGLGEGVVFPAMHCIWSKWAPPLERSKLVGFTYAGAQIGNVLTLPLSALLCEYGFDGGWPSIFYIFGAFGVVWFILWMVIASDSPSTHPKISNFEQDYIETTIGASAEKSKTPPKVPWSDILRSLPVYAIVVAHMCANWGTYTLLTNIPAYMREVLKFDIKANGLFSAIPYVAFWAMINVGGVVADKLRSRGWRTKVVRKIMLSLGTLVPALFLVATGYVTCEHQYLAVALLTIAVGFSGFQYPGVMVNHIDIAPPFAGILFGLSNTLGTLGGILAPFAIGVITEDQTQEQWQTVFWIAAAIYVVGAVFFDIFADGEVQEWVKPYMYDEEATDAKPVANDVDVGNHDEKNAFDKARSNDDGKETTHF